MNNKTRSMNDDAVKNLFSGTALDLNISLSKNTEELKNNLISGKIINFTLILSGKWVWSEAKLFVCMICKLSLKSDQPVSRCPMCQALFHESHIFEWLKVKGKCPVCLQNLRPGETEEIKF